MSRVFTAIGAIFIIGCVVTPTAPVYPFGPGVFTTSASTAARSPSWARDQAIARASDFCAVQGERSLPMEINLLTTMPEVHFVTVVFRCFDPGNILQKEST